MPVKSDPWKKPKNDKWIKVGKRVVQQGKHTHPRLAPVFIILKIEVTGNGAKMVHLALESDLTVTTAKWATELWGNTFGFGSGYWIPVPPPPRTPHAKKERTTRFDREDPV